MPENTPNRGYTYPVYTDVADFPVQMQDFATDVDADMEALENSIQVALDRPSVRANGGGVNQSIPQNVATAAQFATEEFDNAAMFDPGVSLTNFTIPSSGLYICSVRVSWSDNNTGTGRAISLRRVSPSAKLATSTGYPGSISQDLFVATSYNTLFPAAAGEVFQIELLHNATAAVGTTTRQVNFNKIADS